MSEGPWIRFFPSDWLAGTRGMTAAETGIYITLIAMMYERGEPIPNDTSRLARLCGTTTAALKNTLSVLCEEGKITIVDGGLWNDRVGVETEIRRDKSTSAQKSAETRWQKPKQNQRRKDANAMHSQSDRNANQKPDTRDNYTAGAGARSIDDRMGELYAALGVTDETKLPSLLTFSEPIQWVSAGCDIDADILPALRTIAARGKAVRSWSYCSAAVFEARDRRIAPAPPVQPQPQATAPPRKPRTVAELAIHRLETGQTTHEPPDEPDRRLGQSFGSGQAQGPGVLELVAIAANGHR